MSGFKIKISTAGGDQSVVVGKSHLSIGKAEHCDVQLTGDAADEHLRVWSDGNHLWGQDLGSKFGTSVNGARLQPMRPIMFRESDVFKLGDSGPSLAFQSMTKGMVSQPAAAPEKPDETFMVDEDTEVKSLRLENQKLQRVVDGLRAQVRNAVPTSPEEEEEVSQVMQTAITEVTSMKEAESRRFDVFKRESVADLERAVTSLIHVRPGARVSKEEVVADVASALRTVLLGERTKVKRRRVTYESGVKYVFILALAGLLCMAYVVRGRWTQRRPASVVYVPPHPANVTYVKSKNVRGATKETGQE